MAEELTALWQEAEQHLREFERLARRTVEEAWLAGDALLQIKEQLPHGAWTPALQERGIAPSSARRFIQLRKQYPQIAQIERFGSVSAALTDKKAEKTECDMPTKTRSVTYLVSTDDLWHWERGEVTALARRLMDADELKEFTDNVTDELRFLADSFESGELHSSSLYMIRRRLACHVNIGPLKENAAAIAETKRRLGGSARVLITYSKARKGCAMSEKEEKKRLVTFWKTIRRKKHCCRNSHFLSKDGHNCHVPHPWDQEDRNECWPRHNREDDFSKIEDDRHRINRVGCYKSIWSKEYNEYDFANGSSRHSLKKEISENRAEHCFFVEYHLGMPNRIAEELFRVRYDTRQLKRSLYGWPQSLDHEMGKTGRIQANAAGSDRQRAVCRLQRMKRSAAGVRWSGL